MTRNVVHRLASRQGNLCCWCSFPLAHDANHAATIIHQEAPAGATPADVRRARRMIRATFEHVLPKAHGGTDAKANGMAACLWCNNYRGTETPEIFRVRLARLLDAGQHPRQLFRDTGEWAPRFQRKSWIDAGAVA